MKSRESHDYQDQEEWAWEKAERRPGNKDGRTIVSVGFGRAEFDQVSECAERLGIKLSVFIRDAALQRAALHQAGSVVASNSGNMMFQTFVNSALPTRFDVRNTDQTQLAGSQTHAASNLTVRI